MTTGEVIAISGMDEPSVMAIVRRLVMKGAVEVDDPSGPALGEFGVLSDLEADSSDDDAATEDPSPAATAPISLAVYALTDVGRVRSNNEDAFAAFDVSLGVRIDTAHERREVVGPRGILLMVSDGMGGANAGEIASEIVVDTLSKRLIATTDEDAARALAESVELSNERVLGAALEPGREGMGATVVAVLVVGNEAITAEVGDSRAYVVREGVATLITKDQTYVQLLQDQGLLTPDMIAFSRARNVVLQAVGKADSITVAQRRLALRSGDVLVLCSDGLSAQVQEKEIAAALEESIVSGVRALVALANDRGGKDNVTVLVARVIDGPVARSDETVSETIAVIREAALASG
jgi:serine/threonine protein phosphatase PrpC